MRNTKAARVAAIEARKATDLDEATKAVEWHMADPERDRIARQLAEAVIRTVPGPFRKGDPVSILRKLAGQLLRR